MKIYFQDKEPAQVVSDLTSKLGTRKMGEFVTLNLKDSDIEVTIKKMGTSTLLFGHSRRNGGREWQLVKEKIALPHRVFKQEIIGKLTKIINQIGGEVLP